MVNNHKKYFKEALEKQVDKKYEMHSKQLNDKFNGFDYKRPDGTTARVIVHDARASEKMSLNDIFEIKDHFRYKFITNIDANNKIQYVVEIHNRKFILEISDDVYVDLLTKILYTDLEAKIGPERDTLLQEDEMISIEYAGCVYPKVIQNAKSNSSSRIAMVNAQ